MRIDDEGADLVRWGLLSTLVLTPLLLSGCGAGDKAATTAEPTKGDSWVVVKEGKALASPAPQVGVAPPLAAQPTGFLPLPTTSPVPTPTSATCGKLYPRALKVNGADVTPGATSGTVTWWNHGGSNLVEYRVTAIAQDLASGEQRDVGWTVVTPGDDCGPMTATVTGLEPKTDYVFSVDAVTTATDRDGTYAKTVARSIPVKTL